ncbi:MFS transporter [Halorubrum gandharaense]
MIGHATFHLYELTLPLFVVVWLGEFDVSATVLGAVLAVGYGLIGIGALPSGVVADRIGSRRLVVASMVGMGAGFLLVSVAPTLPFLALALVLWGAAASIYHPAGLSLITRGAEQRGTVLAYHGLAGNVGTAIGPFVAAVLLTFLDWRTVAATFALPAAVAVLAAYGLDFDEHAAVEAENEGEEEGIEKDEAVGPSAPSELRAFLSRSRALFVGPFVLVFLVAMLAGTYYRGVFTFLPDVLAGLPVFEPVVFAGETFEPSQYAYAGLLMIGGVGQYVGGRVSDYWNPERTILGVLVVLVGVSLLFPVAVGYGLGATLAVCAALGFFVYMEAPVHQALIGKYADADAHGLSFGYTYLGVFGIGAAGASLAGVAVTYGGLTLLFSVLAVLPLVAAVLAGVLILRSE